MSRKGLPDSKIEEMFTAYCESQTPTYVSNKSGVDFRTARKYIQTHNFAIRLAKVREKTEEKVADTIARDRARNLQLINASLAGFVKHLQGKATGVCECGRTVTVIVPTLKAKYTDLCELIKTHNLLVGDPTERTAGTNEEPKLIKLALPVPPGTFDALPTAPPAPQSQPVPVTGTLPKQATTQTEGQKQ
ncbi:MAG: hypothetical protein ABR913_07160 [Sedimentisphaerales bacterium]|jgi:hypothetical protein